MLPAELKKQYAGRAHQAIFLLISATVLSLSMPLRVARADVGPKPSMDLEFVLETEEPLSIVDGKQMQCEEPDCADAEPLEEVGPNRFWCTGDHYSSSSYGYTTYNQLVVHFSAGVTRTSGVFSGGTMKNEYRVTVREEDLEVERVKARVGLPGVWLWVGRMVGPAFAIPLGFLILMGGLLHLLDAWGRE